MQNRKDFRECWNPRKFGPHGLSLAGVKRIYRRRLASVPPQSDALKKASNRKQAMFRHWCEFKLHLNKLASFLSITTR